jgi:hypothetical protein
MDNENCASASVFHRCNWCLFDFGGDRSISSPHIACVLSLSPPPFLPPRALALLTTFPLAVSFFCIYPVFLILMLWFHSASCNPRVTPLLQLFFLICIPISVAPFWQTLCPSACLTLVSRVSTVLPSPHFTPFSRVPSGSGPTPTTQSAASESPAREARDEEEENMSVSCLRNSAAVSVHCLCR